MGLPEAERNFGLFIEIIMCVRIICKDKKSLILVLNSHRNDIPRSAPYGIAHLTVSFQGEAFIVFPG